MELSNYMMFRKIGGPLVEFIIFLPRVGFMNFQITNSSVVKLFWMHSMLASRNCCKKENAGVLKRMLSRFL